MLSHHNYRKTILYFLISLCVASAVQAAPTVTAAKVSGPSGSTINLPIAFDAGGSSVAAIQFNLTFPPSLTPGSITAGDMITQAGKTITSKLNGSTLTIIVFGMNQNIIGKGTLLTAQLKVASGTPAGTLSVPVSALSFSDLNGKSIAPAKSQKASIKIAITQ